MRTKLILTSLLTAMSLTCFAALAAPLSDAARDDILKMRQEEQLARDVYLGLYAKWGLTIFKNIAASEQKHVDAVQALVVKYKLTPLVAEDPAALIEEGSVSMDAAMDVGILIEKTDIADLNECLADPLPADVKRVFSNLLSASESHLAAFESCVCPAP